MKWKKLGKIFDADKVSDWMNSHSAVPFGEYIDDDNFKVYFTTRDKENRSHIASLIVDMKYPMEVKKISEKPVLSPGRLGEFDDSGAMGSCIADVNGEKYLYYVGWNICVTVPFRNSIGLAVSKDIGKTFNRFSNGPLIDRTYKEPHFCATSCVLYDEKIFRMWYQSCTHWEIQNGIPRHYYHIKYAESENGIDWIRTGKVCIDFKDDKEYAISVPRVLKEENLYKMWYSYRGESYRIGYAESIDGFEWERKDEEAGIDVSKSGWDSEMIEYPFIFDYKGDRFMIYNGNGYGKSGIGLAILEP